MNLKYSDSLWPRSFFSKNWSMESVYIYYKYGKNKLNGFSVKFELDYFKVKSKLKQDLIEMYNNKYET